MTREEKLRNKQGRDLKEKSKYHTKHKDKKRERPSLRESDRESYEIISLLIQGLTLL